MVVMVVTEKHQKQCPYCGYTWKPRVKNPKKCPRCGRWLPPWKTGGKTIE